jgi:hypothetical protein
MAGLDQHAQQDCAAWWRAAMEDHAFRAPRQRRDRDVAIPSRSD